MKLIQQQGPLKRLLIICCPHPQGYSTPGPSQGPAISFSLDSESYSYTVNAFFFFFLKASYSFASVQFCSVAQLCLTLCDPMDYGKPGFPVHHQLLVLIAHSRAGCRVTSNAGEGSVHEADPNLDSV